MTLFPPTILAATGHRPDKLGGYSQKVNQRLVTFATAYLIARNTAYRLDHVVSGMALGWDLAWAEAAQGLNIPVIAAVPFRGHHLKWNVFDQKRFARILEKCRTIIVCADNHHTKTYQIRNEWMVNNCHQLVALWNGSNGGTGNCVKYAELRKVNTINLWDEWSEYVNYQQ